MSAQRWNGWPRRRLLSRRNSSPLASTVVRSFAPSFNVITNWTTDHVTSWLFAWQNYSSARRLIGQAVSLWTALWRKHFLLPFTGTWRSGPNTVVDERVAGSPDRAC